MAKLGPIYYGKDYVPFIMVDWVPFIMVILGPIYYGKD